LTGFGLRFRQTAHRKRFPLIAVFGRVFLPVLKILAIETSARILSVSVVGASG
jgi:hypothetical protein